VDKTVDRKAGPYVLMEITMKPVRFVFTFAILALSAAVAYAQGGQDFSKVEIKANKVTDKFYTLDGQGGTIGVLIGPDGVFMVDTQFAPLSDKIAAAIKQLTPQPTAITPVAMRTSARWAQPSSRARSCASAWLIPTRKPTGSRAFRRRQSGSRSKPIASS
jgi:hypothetical protein